jgi:hypothetical protein
VHASLFGNKYYCNTEVEIDSQNKLKTVLPPSFSFPKNIFQMFIRLTCDGPQENECSIADNRKTEG